MTKSPVGCGCVFVPHVGVTAAGALCSFIAALGSFARSGGPGIFGGACQLAAASLAVLAAFAMLLDVYPARACLEATLAHLHKLSGQSKMTAILVASLALLIMRERAGRPIFTHIETEKAEPKVYPSA